MRHPIYITLCLFLCGYLFVANARGWVLVHQLNPARSARAFFYGSHHK